MNENRANYLPTDNVGRLFCWECWDYLEKKNPKLHKPELYEKCERCGIAAFYAVPSIFVREVWIKFNAQ